MHRVRRGDGRTHTQDFVLHQLGLRAMSERGRPVNPEVMRRLQTESEVMNYVSKLMTVLGPMLRYTGLGFLMRQLVAARKKIAESSALPPLPPGYEYYDDEDP